MRKIKIKNKEEGFTLIEMIVYVALVGIISIVLFNVTFFVIRANNKIIALSKVSSNANSVMERMTYEIVNSKYIYLPTSNFSSSDAQLSLVTEVGASSNEDITFIDFYVEDGTLFLKEEGLDDPIALTSSDVLVSDMEFLYYKNDSRESVTVDMTIQAKNSAMSDSIIHLVNTVALRSF
ncbi:MAG: prepilin-type N-terminal cleavage/methylation domain-containing protein [Candidatus Pacebacteria bacterium]|nr:prepilin-type N-terminal cleavage/methylation domain-containing protein [Candidatus Paceibacterota bacterium]